MERTIWKELFEPRILQRGYDYYLTGAVKSLNTRENRVEAEVLGSELYEVEAEFDGGRISHWHCDCPYAAGGTPCKHLAAVLYALDGEPRRTLPVETAAREPIEDVIGALDLSASHSLLLRLAEMDEEIEDLIRLYAEPVSGRSLENWKSRVDAILQNAPGRHGYIEYDHAWSAMCSLADFVSQIAESLLFKGYIRESFELSRYALNAAARCNMDDSDGGLSMLAGCCFELWEKQVRVSPPELKREIFRSFQKSYKNAPELSRDCFLKAQLELFPEPEFVRENIATLDEIIRERQAEGRERYYISDLVLKRLELMERLGSPRREIELYEEKYSEVSGVREQIIRRMMAEKRYSEAEALLIEGKELYSEWRGLAAEYSEQLINLYEQTEQTEKLRDELMYQVFHYPQPNLNYVKKLRTLTEPVDWPELRDKILTAGTLYNSSRERLLLEESLYDRLLALVIEQNDISAFERWAPELLPRFPEQFTEACVRCVDSIMRTSYSRNEYARTIANLKTLRAYPNRPDIQLAERWKTAYPARRAMLDELRKAGY